MREILFKAKRIDNGEWVEGYLVRFCDRYGGLGFEIIAEAGIYYDGSPNYISHEVDENTICQYTGLTDKNGQKIWENDVVKYDSEDDLKLCAVVKYGEYDNCGNMDCYLGFYMDWSDTRFWLRKDIGFWTKNREVEVIGNIFDNPELLKGGGAE